MTGVGGFDISGTTGIAYAATSFRQLQSQLYTINLAPGAFATPVGQIDGGLIITAMSVAPQIPEPTTVAHDGRRSDSAGSPPQQLKQINCFRKKRLKKRGVTTRFVTPWFLPGKNSPNLPNATCSSIANNLIGNYPLDKVTTSRILFSPSLHANWEQLLNKQPKAPLHENLYPGPVYYSLSQRPSG